MNQNMEQLLITLPKKKPTQDITEKKEINHNMMPVVRLLS